MLEQADIEHEDPKLKSTLLTFVVVGGGFSGVETIGELNDFIHHSIKHYYHNISENDIRLILINSRNRILPEVTEELANFALEKLKKNNIDVLLNTKVTSASKNNITLSNDNILEKVYQMIQFGLPILPKIRLLQKNIAPKVRSDLNRVVNEFKSLEPNDILKTLYHDKHFILKYNNNSQISISIEDVEVSFEAQENFIIVDKEPFIVFLSNLRDKDLIIKGLVRDLARNLQQLRKEKSYNPTQVLSTAYISNLEDEEISILSSSEDYLTYLVRVKSIKFTSKPVDKINYKEIDIDGKKINISIQ